MIHFQLSYFLSVLILTLFGISFFCFDYYVPYIKRWKANQFLYQSQVYLDEKIGSSPELIKEGIRKARVAHLLNPNDDKSYQNYLELLFLENPAKALNLWSNLVDKSESGMILGSSILSKSLACLQNGEIAKETKVLIGRNAIHQFQYLSEIETWKVQPKNLLLGAEILAETGNHQEALFVIEQVIEKHPDYAKAVFLLTRIAVHLQDRSQLVRLGKSLAPLSSQRSEVGLEAIRHMTLLNFLQPLAPKSLDRCIQLLNVNPKAQAIDFLRIYAMRYAIDTSKGSRSAIIQKCSELFDLKNSQELLVFGNWLVRLKAYPAIIEYIPVTKAKAEEAFFKIRMAALAQVGDLEKMRIELSRATIIPSRWRLVVEARIHALAQNYLESQKSLDRIIPLLSSDPREARAICIYLEQVEDYKSLCHILEKLSTEALHQKYAVTKLLQYQGGIVNLEKLIEWSNILLSLNPEATQIKRSNLYLKLLNPKLTFPSQKLIELTEKAQAYDSELSTLESKITLALAHIKNNSAGDALVALGKVNDWRKWESVRSAWKIIAAHVFKINGDTEKFLILSQGVKANELNRAERESLQLLFNFKIG